MTARIPLKAIKVSGSATALGEFASGDTVDPAYLPVQVNADWSAASGVSAIANKPTLGTAAAQNSTAFDAAGAAAAVTVASIGAATASQGALATAAMPKAGGAFTGAVTSSSTFAASNLSGTNTGDQTSVSGNAGTATTLQTARTIAGVSFNGSADIAIPFANLATPPTTLSGYGITDAGALGIPQNSNSAAYTLVLTDNGKHIYHPSADTTARTWTIPANSSVAFPVGAAVTFINDNAAGVITIAITTDTMRLAGAGTTGSRTLAANGVATAIKVTSTVWQISGTGLT